MVRVLRKLAEEVGKETGPKKSRGVGTTKDPLSYAGVAAANTNRRTLPELLMSGLERRIESDPGRQWGFQREICSTVLQLSPLPVVLRMRISPAAWNDGPGEALQLIKEESKICRHDMGVQGR